MMQIELTYIHIKCGIVHLYVDRFLNSSSNAMVLLPIILKLSYAVLWPVMQLWLCIGEGSFRCSLNLSPKVLEVSPIYSSSHTSSPHWNQ